MTRLLTQRPYIPCPAPDHSILTRRYLRRMETDSSPEVRRAALHQLAVSKATLPAIVRRTRDAKDVVRKHAFKMIGDKVRAVQSGPQG